MPWRAKFKKSKMPLSSLKEIPLKRRYDPSADGSNLLKDFYLPCLSVSNRYDRISAYFSSAILKSFCSGLHKFFANKGHIRFIFSNQISPEEMKNIEEGYKTKMDDMAKEMDRNDSFLMDDFEVCNLSYLIEHGLAEVKIAFMLNSESALCHIKAGIFEDSKGYIVYFDGSGNETVSGILRMPKTFTFSQISADKIQMLMMEYLCLKSSGTTHIPQIPSTPSILAENYSRSLNPILKTRYLAPRRNFTFIKTALLSMLIKKIKVFV